MATADALRMRIEGCNRVIALAAARGDKVPAIVARRNELAAELAAAEPEPTAIDLICEDCGGRWDLLATMRGASRGGCICDDAEPVLAVA